MSTPQERIAAHFAASDARTERLKRVSASPDAPTCRACREYRITGVWGSGHIH